MVRCPSTVTEILQCGGRPGRAAGSTGVFVTFFEPQIHEIEPEEFDTGYNTNNPDQTHAPLTDKSNKRDRATLSAICLAQLDDNDCIRRFFASEMGYNSADGTSRLSISLKHPDIMHYPLKLSALMMPYHAAISTLVMPKLICPSFCHHTCTLVRL